MFEKKRLSFDCCADHDNAQMGQFSGISPCKVENIEERLEECLLQLEKVRKTFSLCSRRLSLFAFPSMPARNNCCYPRGLQSTFSRICHNFACANQQIAWNHL